MEQYETYRDSGIPWLGSIPNHWEISKFSYTFQVIPVKKYSIQSTKYEVKGKYPIIDQGKNSIAGYSDNQELLYQNNGCIIFGNHTRLFKYVDFDFIVGADGVNVFQNINKNYKLKYYYYYYSISKFPNNGYARHFGFVKDLKLPVPPIEEQEEIIKYLDSKIGAIDKLISKKKQQAQLFKENKQAIINDVITKGLDPNVKLKDTNLEYVGKIPAHWEIQRLDRMADIRASNIDKKSKDNEKQVLICNYMDVYKNQFIVNDLNFMKATASNDQIKRLSLQKGDVLITKDSETAFDIATSSTVKEDLHNVVLGYHTTLLRFKMNGCYFGYVISARKIQEFFSSYAQGVTRVGLSSMVYKTIQIPMPPLAEQQEIVKYLDRKTYIIDELIQKINQSIELLEEYKISLIFHVVTGKMKI